MTALSLYITKKDLYEKMTRLVKEKLGTRCTDDVVSLEEYLELTPKSLTDVMYGEQVSARLFGDAAMYLGLSVQDDAIGVCRKLDLTKEQRSYWEEAMRLSPIVPVGAIMGSASDAAPEITLEMYIALRAIEEFYQLEDGQKQ